MMKPKYLFFVFALATLTGCATLETGGKTGGAGTKLPAAVKGVYHQVKRDETLWRIAKTYNVSIADIVAFNKISDTTNLEKNQMIFIPGADRVLDTAFNAADRSLDFIWPVKGKVIRSFHAHLEQGMLNNGIQIAAPEGTPVVASRTGKVVFVDYLNGYGGTVILDHHDGYFTVYARNADIFPKLEDTVVQGQPIGRVGRAHGTTALLFEVRRQNIADNPIFYLP
ncbi:MAG: peptidoglycan DD-metalloendopeptidase family protein [Candidatus Omnitrophica bacterium]|nr:peptidoglycan DD-metalloendopeptidase family protein [Candidatus Omnitrophota bacterium]